MQQEGLYVSRAGRWTKSEKQGRNEHATCGPEAIATIYYVIKTTSSSTAQRACCHQSAS